MKIRKIIANLLVKREGDAKELDLLNIYAKNAKTSLPQTLLGDM